MCWQLEQCILQQICESWPWNNELCSHSIFSFVDNPNSTYRTHAHLKNSLSEGKTRPSQALDDAHLATCAPYIYIIVIIFDFPVLFGH